MLFIIASSIHDHEPAAFRSHKTDIAIGFGNSFGQVFAARGLSTRDFDWPVFIASRLSFLQG